MTSDLSTAELDRILDAVDLIEECLGRLVQTHEAVGREEYRTNPDTQAMVERRFVKMTEATLDIGTVLIVHEQGEAPESNPKTMQTLGHLDILSDGLATEMADAARFRNVLAHTYGSSIDHDLVYNALGDLERYRNFVISIRRYLETIGALDSE